MSNLFDNLLDNSDDIIIEKIIPAKRLKVDESLVEVSSSNNPLNISENPINGFFKIILFL